MILSVLTERLPEDIQADAPLQRIWTLVPERDDT